MCFKYMNKQHNNKKHMILPRIYPCSSELSKRQQLSLWGKGMRTEFQMCWRDFKRRGNRRERKDYWSTLLIVPQNCLWDWGKTVTVRDWSGNKRHIWFCTCFGDRNEYLFPRGIRKSSRPPPLPYWISLCRSLTWVLVSSSIAYGKLYLPIEMFSEGTKIIHGEVPSSLAT